MAGAAQFCGQCQTLIMDASAELDRLEALHKTRAKDVAWVSRAAVRMDEMGTEGRILLNGLPLCHACEALYCTVWASNYWMHLQADWIKQVRRAREG